MDSRWIVTKSDQAAIAEGAYLDLKSAERVRIFLSRYCRQYVGEFAGKPLNPLPWQWDRFIGPFYAFKRKDHKRRFRQASVWVGKNQGKSTICAGISLYELIGADEPGAIVVNLASTREQADIVFQSALNMIEQSPELQRLCENRDVDKVPWLWVRENIKTVFYKPKSGPRRTYKVMSGGDRSKKGKHGFPISCLIFDEIAEQSDRDLFDQMRANCQKRTTGKLISISHAGYRTDSIGKEQFDYASKVQSGEIIDTAFLPCVFAADPADDWTTLETYKKANPSFGTTTHEDTWKQLVTEATNEPRKQNLYKTEYLNLWCGSATSWLSALKWAECRADYTEDQFLGQECIASIDYARKRDLCAYTLLFEREGKVWIVPRAFIPRGTAQERQATDHFKYVDFAANPKNNLYLTDGDVIDPKKLIAKLVEDSERFKIKECAFDPNGMEVIRQTLEFDHNINMVEVPQWPRYMGPAYSQFERMVNAGEIRHPGNGLLTYCLENCQPKESQGQIMIGKGGDKMRNDLVVAACIGLSRWLHYKAEEAASQGAWIYDLNNL